MKLKNQIQDEIRLGIANTEDIFPFEIPTSLVETAYIRLIEGLAIMAINFSEKEIKEWIENK